MKKKVIAVASIVAGLVGVIAVSGVIGYRIAEKKVQPITVYAGTSGEDTTDYAFAHEITNNAEAYYGKEITLRGYYSNSAPMDTTSDSEDINDATSSSENTSGETSESTIYHFITVFDKYRDCYITIEFTSPDNIYPAVGDFVSITGTFGKYNDGGSQYLTIAASKVEKIS